MSCKILILGASFYGCGLAAAHPQDTLILESSVVPGSDFSLQFYSGTEWDAEPSSQEARDFLSRLRQRKALSESGALCVPSLAPMLSEFCISHGISVEYSCNVIQYSDQDAVAVGVGGPKQYHADMVVDARPACNGQKYLTALVTAPSSMSDGGKGPFVLRQSTTPCEFHLSFQVPESASWSEARAMFHRAWDMRPAALRYSSILLIGTRFSFRNHPNPVLALDAGIRNGRMI